MPTTAVGAGVGAGVGAIRGPKFSADGEPQDDGDDKDANEQRGDEDNDED